MSTSPASRAPATARSAPKASPKAPAKVSLRKVSASAGAPTTDQIYHRIVTAVLEHRLQPGTQLVEDRLAGIFEVSRTKIREAVGRLVHDRIATNILNRGAFIASPTPEEARQVFAARRLIEPELARQAALRATPRQIASLRTHIAREVKAQAGSNPYALVPLTGEFHLMLADIAGNGFLARTLRELESLTCLSIILYDAPGRQTCMPDEHEQLVDAVQRHDGDAAAALMLHHLHHIEAGLDLAADEDLGGSLEDAFK